MGRINLNMNFAKSVIVETDKLGWIASPTPGVERKLLEREDAESGRATTIVRYRAGVSFPQHRHSGGEEYLVLEGTFSDEHGDFSAGAYVRNPPGSRHSPFSRDGCTIFVKLCQMKGTDEAQLTVNTREEAWRAGSTPGHSIMLLYRSTSEHVTLERLERGTSLGAHAAHGGEEILVLDGSLDAAGAKRGPYTWLRIAPDAPSDLSSQSGCTLWIKRGHLRQQPSK